MAQLAPKTKEIDIDILNISRLIGASYNQIDSTFSYKVSNIRNWHLLVSVKSNRFRSSIVN